MGVCNGECFGDIPEDEHLTSTRCYCCGLSQLYETLMGGGLSVAKPATQGHKWKRKIFHSFLLFCILAFFLLSLLSWHDVVVGCLDK